MTGRPGFLGSHLACAFVIRRFYEAHLDGGRLAALGRHAALVLEPLARGAAGLGVQRLAEDGIERLLQLAVAHPVPNVLDVLQNIIVIYSVLISIMIKLYGTNEKKR